MSFVICISECFFTRNIQTTGHLQDQSNKNNNDHFGDFFDPTIAEFSSSTNRWQKVMFKSHMARNIFPQPTDQIDQWTSSSKNKCLVTALVGSIHHHHLKPWGHAGHARFRGSDRFVARLFQRYPETLIKIACWNPVQHWRGPLWKIILTNKVQWLFVSFCYV